LLFTGPLARLERMLEIRGVEDAILRLFADGLVRGSTHTTQGQEAVSVALASVLDPADMVTCTYRGHATALALGLTPESVLGEVLGRTTGSIGGIGGSMHLCDPEVGLLPTFAIVGAGIPVAVGAGIAAKQLGTGAVGVAVFGDGATNIGAFHEGLNLASVWEAPVLFVCENNLYGEYSRIDLTTPFEDLYLRGGAYGFESRAVDGQDVEALRDALAVEIDAIRRDSRPRFVEVKTYRFVGHSRTDPATYRPPGEKEKWMERDPIDIAIAHARESGLADDAAIEDLRASVSQRVESAVESAMAAPGPELTAMFRHISAHSS
jgi:pyruvate dehydrogenase E1 component alpha subunit